jgi:oxalate decarboxylase
MQQDSRTNFAASPEPMRGAEGAPIIGPTNRAREAGSRSRLCPPPTDSGTLPSLKWSFADSHNRLQPGGWARQTTGRELPIAQTLNIVNMRLKAGAIRELHWHIPDEWGFVTKGRVAFTPYDLVKAHLNIDKSVLAKVSTHKTPVVPA